METKQVFEHLLSINLLLKNWRYRKKPHSGEGCGFFSVGKGGLAAEVGFDAVEDVVDGEAELLVEDFVGG